MNYKFANTSNIVFIYPVIIALLGGLYLGLILNLSLLLSSFAYHNSKEKKYLLLDSFFSWSNIIYNLYLCYLFNFHPLPFGIAFLFLIIGLYGYARKVDGTYDKYHALWHISCAAITSCCFLGYILYR